MVHEVQIKGSYMYVIIPYQMYSKFIQPKWISFGQKRNCIDLVNVWKCGIYNKSFSLHNTKQWCTWTMNKSL